MSDPQDGPKKPDFVSLYGFDHSPWVQAVLVALHEAKIPYDLTTLPPPKLFLSSGIMMPAAKINGGKWRLDSEKIIHELGYKAITDENLRLVYDAWVGVLHRPDSIPQFFRAFSRSSDEHPNFFIRFFRNFFRSFAAIYFCGLIRIGRIRVGYKPPQNFGDQFLEINRILADSDGQFLDGETPGSFDFLFFGILQCHSSIPVPPLASLQSDERLQNIRDWLSRMDDRLSGYGHSYTAKYFDTGSSSRRTAKLIEQGAFWMGLLFYATVLPITALAITFAYRKARQT